MSSIQLKLMLAIAAICIVAAPVAAISIPVTGADLVDSRSTPDASGVIAFGASIGPGIAWSHPNGGFKIGWSISQGVSDWSYSYTISNASGGALSKGLSHWILQVSEIITPVSYTHLTLPTN